MALEVNPKTKGSLLIFLGASLWGLCFLVAKVGGQNSDPLVLTTWIAIFGACGAYLNPGCSPRIAILKTLRKQPLDILGVAISGMIVGNLLMIFALKTVDLTLVSLLERSQPIFVLMLSHFILKERLNSSALFYCLLALCGGILLLLNNPANLSFVSVDPLGLLCTLGAGFSWALSTIFGKRLVTAGVVAADISALRFIVATVILIPLICATMPLTLLIPNFTLISTAFWYAFFGLAGFLLYYAGLKEVTAGVSSFLELGQPLVGVLCAAFVLNESLSIFQIMGIPILLFAVARLAQGE